MTMELGLDLDGQMRVLQMGHERFLERDLPLVAVLWHSNQLVLRFVKCTALLEATQNSLSGKTITASLHHRDDGGMEVHCTLLSGKEHCRLPVDATSTLRDLRNSLAKKDHDPEGLGLDGQILCPTGAQIFDESLRLSELGSEPLTLRFLGLGARPWREGARKFLAALAVEAFHPKSKAFDVGWTLRTARPVTREEVEDTVEPFLGRLGVSSALAVPFMRFFWRLAAPMEEWNLLNLALLQNFDPGMKTNKFAFSEHWLQLARHAIAERVPRRPGPVILPKRNEHGSIIGVELFVVDDSFPDSFDRNLESSLRLGDLRPRASASNLMRVAAAIDLGLNPSLPIGELVREAGQDLQLDPPASPEDVVRMAHVLLRLSCELPAVEVEGSLHGPLLQRVAALRRWRLKVLHFSEREGFRSDSRAERAEDLRHHVGALDAEQQVSGLQAGLMLLHLPMKHLGDVGDVCRKLSQIAPVRFIICVQELRMLGHPHLLSTRVSRCFSL